MPLPLPSLSALLLGALALACGADPAQPAPEDDTTAASTSLASGADSPSGGVTSLLDSGGTTLGPLGTSSDGGMGTVDPPSFDLGVPDMPYVPPPPLPEFDCAAIPDAFVSYQLMNGPRAYHGLAISSEGMAIGSDGPSLIESTYDGMWGVFIPGMGPGQQMDWLVDGDLVFSAGDGSITRVGLDATTSVIQAGVGAYGVVVGPDEQIYVTGGGGGSISRIDPESGGLNPVVPGNGANLHSLGFSPDGRRLYVGTIGNGTMYYVDFDDSMTPTSGLQVFTQVGGGSGWHDAVAVDLCGYLYVPDYYSRNLYRVSPSGESMVLWDPPNQAHYAHGLAWGTGEHGWKEDALYLAQPYNGNTVAELVVGVPPRDWPAIAVNAPEPL
ncbi:MAG: SMP-30/gluconolactonase/LRE family protein [Myxococcales bacterium]|nr:SMP-30/gluconolactonase/LRE family protein [Myxococcales bacterium]